MLYNKTVLIDLLKKYLLGMGLGAVADAAIEILKIPVLNDSGTFGNAQISNFELAAYAISVFGTTAGIADIAVGKGVVTFTRESFPIFAGFGAGVYFYEHTFADMLGVRKFNPYAVAGKLIPPVLPPNTHLPFVPSAPAVPPRTS